MAIIKDRAVFEHVRNLGRQVSTWKLGDAGLFGNDIRYCDWLEFRVGGFIDFVNALSLANGDDEYFFFDVCADERNDLNLTSGEFPAAKFDARVTERDYINEIHQRVKFIDGVEYEMGLTNEYAFFPLSMNWHIYGLYDIELARIQSRAAFPATPFPHDYIPEEEAHRLIRLLD